MRTFLISLLISCFFASALPAQVQALPATVEKQCGMPLQEVGKAQYQKLGFNIYNVSLWAPDGVYSRSKPYALQLRYTRSLSKDTIVSAVMDDVRKQRMADESTLSEWENLLNETMPSIKEGDEVVGISVPGKPSTLFYNGRKIASFNDKRLSDSFFNIWLGSVANPHMRAQLIGEA